MRRDEDGIRHEGKQSLVRKREGKAQRREREREEEKSGLWTGVLIWEK